MNAHIAIPSRIDPTRHLKSDAARGMLALQRAVDASGLEPSLLELVKTRASQINHCAYCLDMHTKDARAVGETEQRLFALAAWEEAPFFTARERAALGWTEAVTRVADTHVPDDVHTAAREHFTEDELIALTWAIAAINVWNRLAVSFRLPVGGYQAPRTI